MRKWIKNGLFTLALLLALVPAAAAAENTTEFAGGEGTTAAPYLVETAEHLNNVRSHLGAHYRLTADIVFTEADFAEGGAWYNEGAGWHPIGDGSEILINASRESFAGTFDGGGHSITGLYLNTEADYAGLFGILTGTVKDLEVTDVDVTGGAYAGGIVGYAGVSAITGCRSSGTVTAVDDGAAYAGGIAGYGDGTGTITGCASACSVFAKGDGEGYVNAYAGGITGCLKKNMELSACYSTGSVKTEVTSTASDAASAYYYSYVYSYAGGIVGYAWKDAVITDCYSNGDVSADGTRRCASSVAGEKVLCAGGIAGYLGGSAVTCYSTGRTRSGEEIGGGNCGGSGAGATTRGSLFLDYSYQSFLFPYTLEMLQDQETFANFDFDTVWTMTDGEDYLLPTLQGIPHEGPEVNTTDFAGGVGQGHDPYRIRNRAQLENVAKYPEAHFLLEADLDLTGEELAELGTGTAPFSGVFDGGDHAVIGLCRESAGVGGLFRYTENAVIRNLTLLEPEITVSVDSKEACAGGIAGRAETTVFLNCRVKGGGVTAVAGDTEVYANLYVGGVAGKGLYCSFTDCSNSAAVLGRADGDHSGAWAYVGGITCMDGQFWMCSNSGSVTAAVRGSGDDSACAGGIVGIVGGNENSGLTDCFNVGAVTASSAIEASCAGGLVGSTFYSVATADCARCYNAGSITADCAGGLFGDSSGAPVTFTSCYYLDTAAAGTGSGTDGGIRCTTEEMKMAETFSGFDFSNWWFLDTEGDYRYPQLRCGELEPIALRLRRTAEGVCLELVLLGETEREDLLLVLARYDGAGRQTGAVLYTGAALETVLAPGGVELPLNGTDRWGAYLLDGSLRPLTGPGVLLT